MRLNFCGKNILIYNWHSINIIPSFAIMDYMEEELSPLTSVIEIVCFGKIFNMEMPFRLPKIDTGMHGYMWSRRRKKWYRIRKS